MFRASSSLRFAASASTGCRRHGRGAAPGIYSTGERSVGSELQSGTLVRLLPDWEIGSSDIHVILPAGCVAKASARAFADFIVANMREIEGAPPKGAKRHA